MNKRKKQFNLIWTVMIYLCVIITFVGIIFSCVTKDYTQQNNNPKVQSSTNAPTYYYEGAEND